MGSLDPCSNASKDSMVASTPSSAPRSLWQDQLMSKSYDVSF